MIIVKSDISNGNSDNRIVSDKMQHKFSPIKSMIILHLILYNHILRVLNILLHLPTHFQTPLIRF
jgi:hypothetical protein